MLTDLVDVGRSGSLGCTTSTTTSTTTDSSIGTLWTEDWLGLLGFSLELGLGLGLAETGVGAAVKTAEATVGTVPVRLPY